MVNSALEFVIIPKYNSPFFDEAGEGCKDRAEQWRDNRVNVNCHYIGSNNSNATQQAKLIKNLIANPEKYNLTKIPDGISISVLDEEIIGALIDKVYDRGIPVITFDSDAPKSKRQAFIGTDNFKFGEQLGKLLNQVNPTGRYYGIITSNGPNLQSRVNGVRQRLEEDDLERTRWKQVHYSPLNCNHDTTLAFKQMYQYALDPNISAIIPVGGWPMWNDTLWKAFIDSTASNLTTVVADAIPIQVELMNKGYVNGLVGQMPYEMGSRSVDELLRIIRNRKRNVEDTLYNAAVVNITPIVEISRIPHPLPDHIVNHNLLGNVVIFGYIAFSIVALSSIGVAIWVWYYRNTRIVRSSQPSFLLMICVGTLILGSSIIPSTFDDNNSSQQAADIACMTAPWLLFLGFNTAFSALFSKTWRIHKIFKNAKSFKRVQVKPWDVILPYFVLIVLNVITLLCWTFISPLKYVRQPLQGTDDWNRLLNTYGTCTSYGSGTKGGAYPYIAVLLGVNGFLLVIANYYACRSRHIETEYSESRCIAIIMASVLQVSLIGIPIIFLTKQNPPASFMVIVSLIFIISMDILGFVFIPKMKAFRRHNKNIREAQEKNKKHDTNMQTDSGLTYSVSKRILINDPDDLNAKVDGLNADEKKVLLAFLSSDDERQKLFQLLNEKDSFKE